MKKPQLKILRQMTNKLPKETYPVYATGKFWVKYVVANRPVNHYRRLKRLIKAGYLKEAREYVFKRTNQTTDGSK